MALRAASEDPKLQESDSQRCELFHHPDFPLEGKGKRLVVFECHVAGKRDRAVFPQWFRDQEQTQPQLPVWLR